MIRILIISRFLPHLTLFLSFLLSLAVKCCKTKALQRTFWVALHFAHVGVGVEVALGLVFRLYFTVCYPLSSPSTLPLHHRTLVRERAIIYA